MMEEHGFIRWFSMLIRYHLFFLSQPKWQCQNRERMRSGENHSVTPTRDSHSTGERGFQMQSIDQTIIVWRWFIAVWNEGRSKGRGNEEDEGCYWITQHAAQHPFCCGGGAFGSSSDNNPFFNIAWPPPAPFLPLPPSAVLASSHY